MKLKNKLLATAAALALTASVAPAMAGSEIMPGITAGIPLGAPPPQGVFVATLPSYGYAEKGVNIGAVVPAWVIWSTPWDILGGHVILDAASPMPNVNFHQKGVPNAAYFNKGGFANPLIDAQLKWNLGGGFFGGVQSGVYLPVRDEVSFLGLARNFASFQAVGALSYLADGYDLSATFIYGTGQHGNPAVFGSWGTNWINLDLTATRKFGKFEVGAVGYGSWDLDQPFAGYARQSQFALGGLVGYDFGAVNVQFKLTRTVSSVNYFGPETRGWANIVIPLWVAAPPPATVAAKY